MQPPVPGLGGTIDNGACWALTLTWIRKRKLLVFLILTEVTGPCAPFASLYRKPFDELPDQNHFPPGFSPWGSANVCSVGLSPSTRIVRVAPAPVGSPTTEFGLGHSL